MVNFDLGTLDKPVFIEMVSKNISPVLEFSDHFREKFCSQWSPTAFATNVCALRSWAQHWHSTGIPLVLHSDYIKALKALSAKDSSKVKFGTSICGTCFLVLRSFIGLAAIQSYLLSKSLTNKHLMFGTGLALVLHCLTATALLWTTVWEMLRKTLGVWFLDINKRRVPHISYIQIMSISIYFSLSISLLSLSTVSALPSASQQSSPLKGKAKNSLSFCICLKCH